VLDLFGDFGGAPNGWRKFSTLLRYVPLDSPIWPDPDLPAPSASVPAFDPSDAARRALDAMAGRPTPRRISFEQWQAEGG
jgi:hypothetical protein